PRARPHSLVSPSLPTRRSSDLSLLDMQLEIGMRLKKAGGRLADIADAPQLLAHGCAVDAADGVGIVEPEPADVNEAAHRIRGKARSLFVGEGDERQRPARGCARVVER